MILDCAFSGDYNTDKCFVDRADCDNSALVVELDEELTSQIPYGLFKIPGFMGQDLSSHICLAACSSLQPAREIHGRGVFTTALTGVLRGSIGSHLTYSQLIYEIYNAIPEYVF